MSWVDKVATNLVITTGDGKSYNALWKNAATSTDYNTTGFEFIGVPGSYADRREEAGSKFTIDWWFVGPDHLDVFEAFKKSAADKRQWVVTHPIYGVILCQPVSITYDHSDLNTTHLTGTLMETINQNGPQITVNPADKITGDKYDLDAIYEKAFVTDIPEPPTAVINTQLNNVNLLYNKASAKINDTLDAQEYFNLFNEAISAVNLATALPLDAIRSVQAMINAPALFVENVKSRINILVDQFNLLRTTIENIVDRNSAKIYENNAGEVVASLCLASVSNISQNTDDTGDDFDYSNRVQVGQVIDSIRQAYADYISDLDSMQAINYASEDSYMPDAESIMALGAIVNYTIANLSVIGLSAKQERVIFLEKDGNIIMLAHRFYKPQPDDSHIKKFISDNSIGINELLGLRKGRRIVYYV